MQKIKNLPPSNDGYSLLEVLIGLLVLSLGLLGLAALQTTGLKFNQQSYQRTQAVFLAYDIIDRIRANSTGKTAGLYDSITTSTMPTISSGQCTSTACTTAQLADYDIYSWKTNITRLLNSGTGSVSTSGTRRTVTIQWKENDLDAQVSVQVDL